MADSILSTLLKLDIDLPAALRARVAVEKVEDAIDDLRLATAKQDAAAKASTRAIKDQAKALNEAKQVASGYADQFDRVSKQVALAGDVQSNLGALRGLAGVVGAGGVGEGIGAAGELVALVEELPRLKAALAGMPQTISAATAALGTSGIGLLGALAALAAAVAFFNAQNEKASQTVRDLIATQEEYYRVIRTGTREQLQEAIDAQRGEADLLRERIAENQRILGQFEEQVGGAGRALADALDLGGARALREETQKLEGQLRSADFLTRRYEDALKNNVTATTDATAAEEKLAAARQLLTDQLADVQISTLLKVNSLSEEAANKRLEEIRLEITTLQQFIDSGTLSAEKVSELSTRITKLGQEAVTLNLTLLPLIQARENEARAIAYQKKQIEETAAAVEKYNADVASIEQKNLDARAAASERYYDRTVAIAEAAAQAAENALRQLERRRSDLARDLGRAGEDAERKRREDDLDAQIDFQREEAKAAREHADNLRRIRRQALRDETQAVQDRDAVALDAAQTRKKDEIQDATDNYQQAARERRIAFTQENADRRQQFARERQDRLLKYQRDLADAQAAYQADLALAAQKRQQDLARAQAAYQQDLILLQHKYTQELTARRNAAVAELRMISQTEVQRVAIMAQAQQALINQARALLAAAGASAASAVPIRQSGGVGSAPFPVPSLASGGRITRDGLIFAHRGEEIRNPKRGQTGGGNTIVLNLNGAQMKEVDVRSRRQAETIVGEALDILFG